MEEASIKYNEQHRFAVDGSGGSFNRLSDTDLDNLSSKICNETTATDFDYDG